VLSKKFIKNHYQVLMANILAVDGNFSLLFGTSASAPVIASMITLINDARITVGKNSVGFLNPIVCFFPHFTSGL
jgi:tripeptidyl-peptidase I